MGRCVGSPRKHLAEVDDDPAELLKPKKFFEWQQCQMEGSNLWHVTRIRMSIYSGSFPDL